MKIIDSLGCGDGKSCQLAALTKNPALQEGCYLRIVPGHGVYRPDDGYYLVIEEELPKGRSVALTVTSAILTFSEDCTPRGETKQEQNLNLKRSATGWFTDPQRFLLRDLACFSIHWSAIYWKPLAVAAGLLSAGLAAIWHYLPALVSFAALVWQHLPLLRLLITALVVALNLWINCELLARSWGELVVSLRHLRRRLELPGASNAQAGRLGFDVA
jgi:hypothetical protein